MKITVEVVSGAEGPCLVIGDDSTGTRVAGPKPWGGGSTVYAFKVDAEGLRKAVDEYAGADAKPHAIPEWREFLQQCAGTAGTEVCGNHLAERAKKLLAIEGETS